LNFPHSQLPQFDFIVVRHVGHDSRRWALPFRQIEDGECGHQESERPPLNYRQPVARIVIDFTNRRLTFILEWTNKIKGGKENPPDSQSALQQGDDSRDEDDGGDDGTANGVVLFDAQGWSQDEGHRYCPPKHHQVVLG
jgi:hypothetical protein